jgi:hypothetical protein
MVVPVSRALAHALQAFTSESVQAKSIHLVIPVTIRFR